MTLKTSGGQVISTSDVMQELEQHRTSGPVLASDSGQDALDLTGPEELPGKSDGLAAEAAGSTLTAPEGGPEPGGSLAAAGQEAGGALWGRNDSRTITSQAAAPQSIGEQISR